MTIENELKNKWTYAPVSEEARKKIKNYELRKGNKSPLNIETYLQYQARICEKYLDFDRLGKKSMEPLELRLGVRSLLTGHIFEIKPIREEIAVSGNYGLYGMEEFGGANSESVVLRLDKEARSTFEIYFKPNEKAEK